MKDETRSFYEQVVARAVARIARGLDEAVDLGALARSAGVAPLHFHHIFRGLTGETPLEMHRRLRLERAARALVEGDAPVTELAFDAGYETHESFTRAFRQAYGAPPIAFRTRAEDPSRARPHLHLAARSGVHYAPDGAAPAIAFERGETTMNVTIEQRAELTVATVTHVGPYATISEAFARLGKIAEDAGLASLAGAPMVGLYHDDPESVPAAELRSAAGVVVPADLALPKGLERVTIPAGRYARVTHEGPLSLLGDTWARLLGEWLPKSGHRLASTGPSYELMQCGPGAAPSELRTEIYVPVT